MGVGGGGRRFKLLILVCGMGVCFMIYTHIHTCIPLDSLGVLLGAAFFVEGEEGGAGPPDGVVRAHHPVDVLHQLWVCGLVREGVCGLGEGGGERLSVSAQSTVFVERVSGWRGGVLCFGWLVGGWVGGWFFGVYVRVRTCAST
jgi:hypothetical protein